MTQDQSTITNGLMEMAATLAQYPVNSITALGNAMLADSTPDSQRASASLNPEGIPIELAITASPERLKFRLVVDPAATEGDVPRRYRRARAALDQVLMLTGTESLTAAFAGQLDAMLPGEGACLAAYHSGPFCMAAAVGEPGIATYIDARTHEAAAFERAQAWIKAWMPQGNEALTDLLRMRPVAQLAAVGLEGANRYHLLGKLYWRLLSPVLLSSLGVKAFAHPDFARFLRLAMRDRHLPSSGLMLSAGYHMQDGRLYDAKVNLCGHCLDWGRANWPVVVADCTQAFALAAIPVPEAFSRPHMDVSFLTFGRTRDSERRVNCYVRPTTKH